MSTTTHAGSGRYNARILSWSLFAVLGAWAVLPRMAHAQPQASTESVWRLAAEISLSPGATQIVLVEYSEQELAVELRTAGKLPHVQDGPAQRIGAEVLVANNLSVSAQEYEIRVRSRSGDVADTFDVTILDNPTAAEVALAARLSLASQLWLQDSQSEEIEGLLAVSDFRDVRPRLSRIAAWQFAEWLLRTSQNARLLEFLAASESTLLIEGDELLVLYANWMRGASLNRLDRIDEAYAQFASLEPLLSTVDTSAPRAIRLQVEMIRGDLGMQLILLGLKQGNEELMSSGVEHIESALIHSAPLGDYKLLGDLNNYLAAYQSMRGLRDDAIATMGIAESLYQRSGYEAALATAKNNQAYSQIRVGNIAEAQRLYREALLILDGTANYRGYATILSRLALTYKITGDLHRAESYLRRAIDLYERLESPLPSGEPAHLQLTKIQTEIELGVVLRLQDRHQDAVDLLLEVKDEVVSDIWLDEFAQIQAELSRSYIRFGDTHQAALEIAQVKYLKERVTRLSVELDVYAVEAEILLLEENYDEARQVLEIALEIIDGAMAIAANEIEGGVVIEPSQQLELLFQLAKAQEGAGDRELALRIADRAINLIADIRDQMDFERQGPTWNSITREVVNHSVSMLLADYDASQDRQYAERAFELLQMNNSISLYQDRISSIQAGEEQNRPSSPEALALWQEMIEAKRQVLIASVLGESSDDLDAREARAVEAYSSHKSSLRLAAAVPKIEPLSLSEVQSRLSSREMALVFSLSESQGHVIAISSAAWNVHRLNSANCSTSTEGEANDSRCDSIGWDLDSFLELVDLSIDEMKTEDEGSGFAATLELSSVLLSSVSIDDGIDSLIIENAGLLSSMPFSGLSISDDSSYLPLISEYAVLNTPSFTLYFDDAQVGSPNLLSRTDIAVFADPAFDIEFGISEADKVGLGLESNWRSELDRLPFTALEASQIGDVFADNAANIYTGERATISNFLQPGNRSARIIHLASHGFSSTANSDYVGFLLAPDRAENIPGFLTYTDVKEYSFVSELVVISGCETASGELLRGEGMMGLSRTFLAQGAKSTIATLWPVSDRASAKFMSYFYDELKVDGNSPAQSLRNAQQKLRDERQYRNPSYWAGYVLNVADSTYKPVAATVN